MGTYIRIDPRALIRHSVAQDLAGQTKTAVPTDTEGALGESFPQTLGGPGLSVNKTYTFTAQAQALRRKWTITRGASVTTPPGSTWRYVVGDHIAEWSYPNPPPATWIFTGEPLATAIVITNATTNAEIQITGATCEVVYVTTPDMTPEERALGGRNIAETIYNLEIAVDVEGHYDDPSGTYTGTPDALIIRPADILRHLAAYYLEWILADRFDTTSFNAARAAEAAAGIRLDFVLTERINSRDLFEQIREQTMSGHFLGAEGKYKRFLYPFSGSSLKTFLEFEDILEPIRVGLTPPGDIYNIVGIRYRPDPWSSDLWAYVEKVNATSQGTGNPPSPGYGVTRRWTRDFFLLRDATAADAIATNWLNWLKDQFYLVEFPVRPEWIHLEPWDRIAITSTRMPGNWTAREFVIQEIRKRLGEPRQPDMIILTARAVAP